jgi:serine protease Do
MSKRAIALVGALTLGIFLLVVAHAAAFEFPWSSQGRAAKVQTAAAQDASHPAPAGALEPNESVRLPSWAPIVKRVMPTVVQVAVVNVIKTEGSPFSGMSEGQGGNGNRGPFQFWFGNPFGHFPGSPGFGQAPRHYTERGLGSGVIVSPDGYILTNNHVVGKATEIHVTLMDKREFTAKVIGKDRKTDLALIKINAHKPLPCAQLGDSHDIHVGDWVLAVGNPFGFSLTATTGIVSAKGRVLGGSYDEFIQTDAAINPGNSGGPLFNTQGQVIGINTAIYSSSGSNAGIGFAIPIDLAKQIMQQLKEHGHVIRGWLGVEIQRITPSLAQSFNLPKPEGALVAQVQPDTPAEKAGFKPGDIIVKFKGRAVNNEHVLPEMVAETAIGKTVPIEVIRNGKHITLHATIAQLNEQQLASAAGSGSENWGLSVQTLTPDIAHELGTSAAHGVVIGRVRPGSPAEDAGLRSGDVILQMDHMEMNSARQFASLAHQIQSKGKSALLLVMRGSATMYTVINPKG